MDCTCDLGRELVYQDVTVQPDIGNSDDDNAIVDLTIPTGKVVVGSGAVVTQVMHSGVLTDVDSLTSIQAVSAMARFTACDGPNVNDSTKWRFILDNFTGGSNGTAVKVRVWIAAVYS